MVNRIPWREDAVLIRTSGASIADGGRVIVAEGPLYRLLDIADTFRVDEIERHYIAMPERHVPPFRYEGLAIRQLLGRMDRPGALDLLNIRAPAVMGR